ncbi:MAG TPA: tRNA (N6-isopentenyl adenosine(37)-C2)-methylthiotransferase MiaB [Verrucomicrobiae bacterium]|nr:tRNA (N6-isopentenyl adenosine(37)-C2)-methylthiotransferase MiaB [Verrucomicrobiae bacterium]
MKRVYIKTYGCQMNERDSEAVAAMLRDRGYEITSNETNADVILLNTCSVRDLAERKAIGKMDTLVWRKKRKPELVLGYMGCMAQSRGESLTKKQKTVDLVVGTQRFHHVPEYLDQVFAARKDDEQVEPIIDVAEESGSESTIKDHVLGTNGDRQVVGFVSIMQGCEMFCTFCIVPYTRGSERSRPIAEIVDEVCRLVDQGVKEVTLLGQIVTSYGRKDIGKKNGKSAFVQLLEAVNEVKGLERIRFTAPHPKGFGDDLVQAYAELPKLCELAHLPIQSGSNRILKAMNRGYTREWYLRVVDKLRAAQPRIAINTDVIVGFPGETEEDFEETAALMRQVEFDQAYIFKYSKRQDTPAADMADQVSEREKERRNQVLLEILNAGMARANEKLVGQTVEILVEGRSEKAGKRMFGRTRTNKLVFFDGSERHRGRLLPVRIERATHIALYGEAGIYSL